MRRLIGFLFQLLRELIHLLLGVGACCRFTPCCSVYSREAVNRHGLLWGMALVFRRLSRCHPLGSSGWDPVPPARLPSSPSILGSRTLMNRKLVRSKNG